MIKISFFIFTILLKSAFGQYGGGIDETTRANICNFTGTIPVCAQSKYRSTDGTCNNLGNPLWGTPFNQYQVLGTSNFGDSISTFPIMNNGSAEPNARDISRSLYGSQSVDDLANTVACMQFGQIMAHDMSFGVGGAPESCCSNGQTVSVPVTCNAIPLVPDDPFFGSQNLTCMAFTRNVHDHDLHCDSNLNSSAPVRQITKTTSFLDLSNVYGDTVERAQQLRAFSNGLMVTVMRNGKEFPPQDPNALANCVMETQNDPCYLSSDERINTNPGLALMQIYFLREHNRLARALAVINPSWNDETLFQEARRINIAQYQQIVYYEWLPIILGKQYLVNNKLTYVSFSGNPVNDYNSKVKPVIFNEHANAASRVLHTMIVGNLKLMNEQRQVTSTKRLRDVFHKPAIYEQFFDDFGRGMVTQNADASDTNVDGEVTNFLFPRGRPIGDDLKAIDIQRGRDHGLPSYASMRVLCGLSAPTSWNDYSDVISLSNIQKLQQLYSHYLDVELNVGLSLETVVTGTLVGPTTRCIMKTQFYASRVGDRYFFETGTSSIGFSTAQLTQIRRATFARIFCDNSNGVTSVQPFAFKVVGPSNPIISCANIAKVDLSKWKDCSALPLSLQNPCKVTISF